MLTRRDLLSAAAIGAAGMYADLGALTPRGAAPTGPRRTELLALKAFAERTHPEGSRAALDPTWHSLGDTLASRADRMSDAEYVVAMLRLLAWFKDGHTSVYVAALDKGIWGLRLPVAGAVFYDGLYVTSAKDEALPLLGARVTHLAGHPTAHVMREFAAIFPSANTAGPHRWAGLLLRSPGLLHGLGLMTGADDQPVAVEGAFPNGHHVSVQLRPRADGGKDRVPLVRQLSELERYSATQNFGPQGTPGETGRNFVWEQDGGRTLYVSCDRMSDDDFGKPFAAFSKEVVDALDRSHGDRLVIDLRRNGGGNNMLSEPIRHHIERSRFNYPGRLCVLIAPHTFSAAQNLAVRLERETFATFVGEPTSPAPNGYGDAAPFKPAAGSGLPSQVSTLRWMDSSPFDTRRWLMPDVLVPELFADHVAGRDRSLDTALTYTDSRAPDDGLLTAPWERPSQSQKWEPFWLRE